MRTILWWGQEQYMLVIPFDPYWIMLEHGHNGQTVEYVYVPHLPNRIQRTPRGVRMIYGNMAECLHKCMIFTPPEWVEYATII